MNILVTGPPRIGKTTVIEKVVSKLEKENLELGGIYAPEIREDSKRVGFEIRDVMTGESRTLAHVERDEGPKVGKYRVDVSSVDGLSKTAFKNALEDGDFVVIDEIAPMETYSDEFKHQVRRVLDSELPVIAAVHRGGSGFVGEVKERADVRLFEITKENRDGLPDEIAELVLRG